jgi:hypothetical protein
VSKDPEKNAASPKPISPLGARMKFALWMSRFDAIWELDDLQFVAEPGQDPKTASFTQDFIDKIPLDELTKAAERMEETYEILNTQLLGLKSVIDDRTLHEKE